MDGGPTASIILGLFVLIDIIYYGFSSALEQLNYKEIAEKAESKKDRKTIRLLWLLQEPQNFVDTIQLIITLLNMLIGWIYMEQFVGFTKHLLSLLIEKTFQFQIGVEIIALLASLLTFIIVLYIFLLFCVSLPKKIAACKPERWAYLFVDVIYVMNHIMLPFTGLISLTVKGIMHLLGMKVKNDDLDVTEEEIIHMVNEVHEQGLIEAGEVEMISNIFEFHDKEAQDIMTHRNNIIALDGNTSLSEAVHFVLDGNHSRYLVYEENIDNIVGVLHMRDVLRYYWDDKEKEGQAIGKIAELLREPEFIPLTRNIHDLFEEMQSQKLQMVVVIDEYGQTAGLVAMEDILEEIVGNILDEYDVEEKYIQEKGDNEYIIEGKMPLEELEERFGIEFNEEEFETINGFMISKMDKIPDENEQFEVEVDGYLFKIMSVQHKMIHSVLVTRLQKEQTIKNNQYLEEELK